MTGTRALIGVTVAVVVVTFAIGIAHGDLVGFGFPGAQAVWGLAYVAAGALIVRSRSDHPVGRLIMWAGVLSAAVALAMQAGTSFGVDVLFDAANAFGWMAIDVALIAAFIRFPDGEQIAPWAGWFLWLAIASMAAAVAVWSLAADLPSWIEQVPFGIFQGILVVTIVSVVVVLWRRGPVLRRQVGWVAFAACVAGLLGGLAAVVDGPDGGGIASMVSAVWPLTIPLSIFIAVTKYRLYEIDRIVSRTVAYGLVVAVMVGVYVGGLALLGLVLPVEGDIQVAVATLLAVAASVPLTRRVRDWVDRRFFRYRYDSAAVVARVADDLRTTVDLGEVESRAESVIDEVFAPESVVVWLAE
jgi:hypothetical protein